MKLKIKRQRETKRARIFVCDREKGRDIYRERMYGLIFNSLGGIYTSFLTINV